MLNIHKYTYKIRNILKNIQTISKKSKLVIILNYHRIGDVDPQNPFHLLHSVNEEVLKRQLRFISHFGKFVSLGDVRNNDNLSKINFIITFDDVSSTVFSIKPYLIENKIPFTISPCIEIAQNGFGIRNKVYFIIKHIDSQRIYEHVKNKVGHLYGIDENKFSFYRFTKRNDVDSVIIENDIINPLFDMISGAGQLLQAEHAYLIWDDIREHFLHDKLVTIANHSLRHINMNSYNRREIFNDVEKSTEQFKLKLCMPPSFYAVPFGDCTQNLLIDLNDALREYGYKGVLWANNCANIIKGRYDAQIIHLSRIHTPATFSGFIKRLVLSLEDSHKLIKDFAVKYNENKNNNNTFVVKTDCDPKPVLSVENIIRQGKDYASSEEFYRYAFTDNPYKNTPSDYCAVVSHDRIVSLGYFFYYPFVLAREIINGMYFSGWRKLPQTNRLASALTYFNAIKQAPIIGSNRPTKITERIYQDKIWKKVPVKSFKIPLAKCRKDLKDGLGSYKIRTFDAFPDEIIPLTEEVNKKYFFTIARTPKFYKWRFDSYPLLKTTYYILYENNNPKGYFVLQSNDEMVAILDFYCNSIEHFSNLLQYIASEASDIPVSYIGIVTSLKEIALFIENNFSCESDCFFNYYHFNTHFSHIKLKIDEINQNWGNYTFHETQVSGDTLLRPGFC